MQEEWTREEGIAELERRGDIDILIKALGFGDFRDFRNKGSTEKLIFPIDAFPDVIKQYVIEVSESLQVPIDMVAVCVLGVLSTCLQGKYYIKPRINWVEPLNLYIFIAANPSERKSPTLKEVRYPVDMYVSNVNSKIEPEHEKYMIEKNILTKKIENLSNDLARAKPKNTMQDIEDARQELADLEEVKLLKLIADDVTPEALAGLLEENNERISIISAEGGIFGMLAGRYSSNPNIDLILKGYSGEPYYSDRVTRKGVYLRNPLITILIIAQPSVLKEALENKEFRDRGLVARFIYSVPESAIGKREYNIRAINKRTRENYNNLIYELLESNAEHGFNTEGNTIILTKEADKLSEQFFYEIEWQLLNNFATFEDWAGKYHGLTMRIAGILHCVKNKLKAPWIALEADTMQSAIEIGRYFEKQTEYVFNSMVDSEVVRDAKYLLKQIDDFIKSLIPNIPKIPKIKKNDLYHKCKGKFEKVDKLQPGLDELERRGYIKIETIKPEGSGRPSDWIYVNPKYIEQKKG